jgi:hypothetical protein
MAGGSAYIFNMTLSTLYLSVNTSHQLPEVAPISNTSPYSTLGTPQKISREAGTTYPPSQFGDKNRCTWSYDSDSNERHLDGIAIPSSYDIESDIQIYVFKNSLMVRYGDNATYFSSAGAVPA